MPCHEAWGWFLCAWDACNHNLTNWISCYSMRWCLKYRSRLEKLWECFKTPTKRLEFLHQAQFVLTLWDSLYLNKFGNWESSQHAWSSPICMERTIALWTSLAIIVLSTISMAKLHFPGSIPALPTSSFQIVSVSICFCVKTTASVNSPILSKVLKTNNDFTLTIRSQGIFLPRRIIQGAECHADSLSWPTSGHLGSAAMLQYQPNCFACAIIQCPSLSNNSTLGNPKDGSLALANISNSANFAASFSGKVLWVFSVRSLCGLVFSVMELRTVLSKDFWFFCCWIVVLLCCCCRHYCFSCCWWWWCCCCCYCCCCCGLLLLLLLLLLFLFLLLLLFLVLVLVFEWQWKKNELQRWSLFRGLHGAPFMKRQGKGPTVDFTTPTKNIKKFQPEKSKNWIKGPFHTFPTSW